MIVIGSRFYEFRIDVGKLGGGGGGEFYRDLGVGEVLMGWESNGGF